MVSAGAARYVARCAGCGHRAVVDAVARTVYVAGRPNVQHSLPIEAEDLVRRDPWTGEPAPAIDRTAGADLWVRIQVTASGGRPFLDAIQAKVFKRVGLWCPTCDVPLRPRALKATPKPGRPCDDRCFAAISSTCDCSCGGARHGSAWIDRQMGAPR